MNYKHLSQIERYQIYSLMKAQHNITQIARLLGRDKSTISRELRRNAGCRGYKAKQACELACKRSESSRNASTLAPWVKEQASELLRLQWSPEQIASKLPLSHESLYLHVYADKVRGGTLWKNLRCQKQKRRRYASGRDRRGQISNCRPLSERPAHIDKRLQVGHWECDTVIGAAHKHAIGTVVERKSGYAVIAKVSNKTSDLMGSAIIQALKPFEARVKTLTYDNGKEFSGQARIHQALGSKGYFVRPFASWARGSSESFNGLLRQFVPKKRQMASTTDEEIKMAEIKSNNLPAQTIESHKACRGISSMVTQFCTWCLNPRCCYSLNNRSNEDRSGWTGTVDCLYLTIVNGCTNDLRSRNITKARAVLESSWHFTYMGRAEGAKK